MKIVDMIYLELKSQKKETVKHHFIMKIIILLHNIYVDVKIIKEIINNIFIL